MGRDVAPIELHRRLGGPLSRTRRLRVGLPVVGLLGLGALDAHAQDAAAVAPAAAPTARAIQVVPSVSVNETLTSNSTLSDANKRGDLVTQVAPALGVRANTPHLQGSLDYSVMGLDYARNTESNSVQQSLGAGVKANAFDDRLVVDANASITHQNISPLGTQSPDVALRTGNQTQVSEYSVAPALQGRLSNFADYRLGVSLDSTHTNVQSLGSSQDVGETLHLGSESQTARFGWGADASRLLTQYSVGRDTTIDSAVGSLVFRPSGDLQLTARGGSEANNIESVNMKNSATFGASLSWIPSTRTNLTLSDDKRFFGNSYNLSFTHRTARTVWQASFSRDENVDSTNAGRGTLMSAFDLVYLQLTSQFPDPTTRANEALVVLQNLGINPLAAVPSGFLSNAVTLQKNLSLSWGYLGARTSVLVSAHQDDTSRLDALSTAVDVLSSGDVIRERGATLSVAHQLTPQTSASFDFSETHSLDLTTGAYVDLRTLSANWSTRPGQRTLVSLGARHSVSSGESSYVESALLATLTLQF